MLIDEILPAAMRTANIAHISPEYATEFLMNYLYSMTGFITKLCQLILYITAQNVDVIQQSQPGKERTGQVPPSGSGLADLLDGKTGSGSSKAKADTEMDCPHLCQL